jgi:ketosteroid isomerase-like protein
MRSFMRLFVSASVLALTLHQSSAVAAPAFRPALETHLAAISGRNLDALLPTLTRGNALTLLAPDGKKLDTRQQFVDLHRGWFASKDEGKWEGEIVRVIETPALSQALVRYRYSSRQPDGKLRISENWLTLTFALEDGGWRLVFDQNTPISVKFSP